MAQDIAVLGIEVRSSGVQQANRDLDTLKRRGGESERAMRAMESAASAASVAIKSIGSYIAINQIVSISRAILEAQAATDGLRSSLSATFGRSRVASEIAYVRNLADDLGLAFGSTATAYAKFAAAANGTALTGSQVRQVFEAVSSAATTFGLSQQEAEGALLAVSQMMSKGVVSAEELRGQLGERLPGALNIAARAMGVTTAELGAMLEQGEVIAADFLPRFATELQRSLGDAPQQAAQGTQAAMNRLTTSWEEAKRAFAESGAASGLTSVLNTLTVAANEAAAAMREAQAQGRGGVFSALAGAGGGIIGAMGGQPFTANTETRKKELIGQIATLQDQVAQLEGKAYRTMFERQTLRSFTSELQAAKSELDRLATKGEFKLPDIKGQFVEQQTAAKNALDKYIGDRKSQASKMDAEMKAEDASFKAATAGFQQGSAEYAKAVEAHNVKLAEIREKYTKKTRTPKGEKEDLNAGFDIAAAESYSSAISAIASAQIDAERSGLQLNAAQAVLYDLMRSPEWARMPEAWQQSVIAQTAAATAAQELADKQREQNAAMEEGLRITEQMRTPSEALGATVSRLNALLDRGAIDWETYSRAVFDAQDKFDGLQKKAEESSDAMSEFSKNFARSTQSTISDLLFDGADKGFKGLVDGFGNAVKRMIADAAAARLMENLFGKDFGTTGNLGSGSWIGQAASWIGSLFSANGNAFAGSGAVQAFANGGAFGNGEVLTRPTAFRFASGGAFRMGIAGEAGPEAALPLKRLSNGKLGVLADGGQSQTISITVNVANGTPSEVRRAAGAGAREALAAYSSAQRYQ